MRSYKCCVVGLALSLAVTGGCRQRGEQSGAPVAPSADPNAPIQVAIGGSAACAVVTGGTVQCWGDNTYGQLGDGTSQPHLVPQPVPGLATVTEVDVGDAHACARKADGSVWCQHGHESKMRIRLHEPVTHQGA